VDVLVERSIITILQSIRIQDIFDIAIVSVLIYGLIIWFKETASRFVIVGISLLGIVYILSRFFQLYLTTVALQGFFAILLIAIVVIFQEELRRIFERIALWGRIRRRGPEFSYEKDIDIIAQASASFIRKKIGALIVIKGEEPIARHIQGGIHLEGILSKAILESIFDPHSIGHDGAVIIDRGRIAEFGCHLPLSLNSKKFGNLGLRHTAALGLSERSDALCIAISEERGTISIAQGGRIDVLENEGELRRVLERFYNKRIPKDNSKGIFKWAKKNFKEKLAAVLLASILWVLFGYQGEMVRRDFIVPIEYRNLAPEWIIEEPKVTEAKVMLMGPVQAFQLLDPRTLKISIDLSRIEEGSNDILLMREMVKTPSNLSVSGLEPDRIRIVASRLIPMVVPIELKTAGKPAPGVAIKGIDIKPSYITVLVPKKLRNRGIKIQTEVIDLNGINEKTVLFPKLILPSEILFVDGRQPPIKVTINVMK
jgi:uncharacterized protein (TIGR00159 family)